MHHSVDSGKSCLSREHLALFILLLVALGFSFYTLTLGWSHSLLDLHPLRQFQTALSIRSLVEGGPWLAYETPLFGEPWSIPFEFPTYQWVVAIAVTLGDLSIEHASRSISILFYYLALLTTDMTLRLWKLPVIYRYCVSILLLTSPLYLFWSRTCMIESLVLFLSLAYLYFGSVYLRGYRSVMILFLAGAFGVLAAITKITTFFGFSIVLAVLILYTAHTSRSLYSLKGVLSESKLLFSILFFCCFLPLLATYTWVQYSDIQKEAAPLARWLMSSELHGHNFGTSGQRLSAQFWSETMVRILRTTIGDPKVLLLAILILFVTRSSLQFFLVAISIFLLVALTFTNLYIAHNYYPYGSAIFIIFAVSSALGAVFSYPGKVGRYCGFVLLLSVAINNAYSYSRDYYPLISKDWKPGPILVAAEDLIPKESIVMVYGADWSSEIAYQIKRKVIMNRMRFPLESEQMKSTLINLRGAKVGGVLNCFTTFENTRHESMSDDLSILGMAQTPVFTHAIRWPAGSMGCELFVPKGVVKKGL